MAKRQANKLVPTAVGQYLVDNKGPSIGLDGKIKPWDYNNTNVNRLTGESDRVGRGGYGYSFNGTDSYASLNTEILFTALADWEISFFLKKTTAYGVETLFSRNSNERHYLRFLDNTNLRFRYNGQFQVLTFTKAFNDSGNENLKFTINNPTYADNGLGTDVIDGFTLKIDYLDIDYSETQIMNLHMVVLKLSDLLQGLSHPFLI